MITDIVELAGGMSLAGSPGSPLGLKLSVTPDGRALVVRLMKPLPPVMVTVQNTFVPTPAVSGRQTDIERGTKKLAVAATGPAMLMLLVETGPAGVAGEPGPLLERSSAHGASNEDHWSSRREPDAQRVHCPVNGHGPGSARIDRGR